MSVAQYSRLRPVEMRLTCLNQPEPSKSTNHSNSTTDSRRQAAELRNLTIDNADFNSGLTRARTALKRGGKPDGQGPSGGKGGKGGKSGLRGGREGKGKAGRSSSSGPPTRSVSRTGGGGLHIQSQIAKVKSSAARANAAPTQIRERNPKPSDQQKQAAAGSKEAARLESSMSGVFIPIENINEDVVEVAAPTAPANDPKVAVFDYKALKAEISKLKKDDLQTVVFKLYSHREDFCQKFLNLSAPHMKERIMMEVLRLDQTDSNQDRELGWATREVLGSDFSKSRKTKLILASEAVQYLYKTDHFGMAQIPSCPGIIFDEGRGSTPVQVVCQDSALKYLQSVFHFVDKVWVKPPRWSDLTKFSSYRNGSSDHIQGTKAFLAQVCNAVSAVQPVFADDWPAVVPNNSGMVELLASMGYRNAWSGPVTNPFAFLYILYQFIADSNPNLEVYEPNEFMASLINRLTALESQAAEGINYYCPIVDDVLSQQVDVAPWISAYKPNSSHEPMKINMGEIDSAMQSMDFSSLDQMTSFMKEMCSPRAAAKDQFELSMKMAKAWPFLMWIMSSCFEVNIMVYMSNSRCYGLRSKPTHCAQHVVVGVTCLKQFAIFQPQVNKANAAPSRSAAANRTEISELEMRLKQIRMESTAATKTPVGNRPAKETLSSSKTAKTPAVEENLSLSGRKVRFADDSSNVAAPAKPQRGTKRSASSEVLDMLGAMMKVPADVQNRTGSTRALTRAADVPVPAPAFKKSDLEVPWVSYCRHEDPWAKTLLSNDFVDASINLHKKSCETLSSIKIRPEDSILNKYSLLTVEVEYKKGGQCQPAFLVMNPTSNDFVTGESAMGSGFATTDSTFNEKHYSRCLLCPISDYRMVSGSFRNVQSSVFGDVSMWYPPTHDEPKRTPQQVECGYTTFIPSYCNLRDDAANETRYGVHREDYYLKQKYHNFGADLDKELTRRIMEILPMVNDSYPNEFPEACDESNAFVLYDATGGYSNRMIHAWCNGGVLNNTIHMAADQVVLNFMTEEGHQALSQYSSCGFRSNDAYLSYRWFGLVGLQPALDYQVEAMADFLNYHKTCTHACIILREVSDFHLMVQENYHLSYSEELPEGAVLQAGKDGACNDKFYKYHLVRVMIADIASSCRMSPVSPPVPKRMRRRDDDDDEENSDDRDDDGLLPGINFMLIEGHKTPEGAGPKKKLYFPTPAAENERVKTRDALFNNLSGSSDGAFAASPRDSMIAFRGSPVYESPMSGLEELLEFKDAHNTLIAEAEAADARLLEAERTLTDLKSCEDESAASTLAQLSGKPDKNEINRKLQLHLAEQQKRIAEAEASIKRLLASR